MPTIEAFLTTGHTDQQKRHLIAAMTDAVVAAVDAPADAVRIFLHDVPTGNFAIGGEPAPRRSLAWIQAVLIAGRTPAQKTRLTALLSAAAGAALAVDAFTVRVLVIDIPNTDFGLGGQTAQALGRGIGRQDLPV